MQVYEFAMQLESSKPNFIAHQLDWDELRTRIQLYMTDDALVNLWDLLLARDGDPRYLLQRRSCSSMRVCPLWFTYNYTKLMDA